MRASNDAARADGSDVRSCVARSRRTRALRTLLVAAVVVTVGVAWLASSRHGSPPRNLILISIDTLRADHLRMSGYARETSPLLDAFARRGTLFTRAVTQAGSTSPAHGALLTSRYYSSYNRSVLPAGPPEWVDTLAEILKRDGFATWGFVDGGYMRRVFGFAQGFDHFEDERVKVAGILRNVNAWLDRHAAKRFFLLIHCYDVHTPYEPPPPFDQMFVDPSYRGTIRPNAASLTAVEKGLLPFTQADLDFVVARYDGGIRYTDWQIGSFLKSLEQRGLNESTAIVIISDHGEEFREHGLFGHWQIYYYPNLHVPLIFYVPGREPRVVNETVELIDVVPTVLDLLGLPPHPDAMGRSLVPLIDGTPAAGDTNRIAFAESTTPGSGWRTVVSNDHQLLYEVNTGERRLYDLGLDPAEQSDVAEQQPEEAARLLDVLESRLADAQRRNTAQGTEPRATDPATRTELEALGYTSE